MAQLPGVHLVINAQVTRPSDNDFDIATAAVFVSDVLLLLGITRQRPSRLYLEYNGGHDCANCLGRCIKASAEAFCRPAAYCQLPPMLGIEMRTTAGGIGSAHLPSNVTSCRSWYRCASCCHLLKTLALLVLLLPPVKKKLALLAARALDLAAGAVGRVLHHGRLLRVIAAP